MKPVYFTRHARERIVERLTTESEVIQTIRETTWQAAEMGKQRARKWHPFGKEHKGTFYTGKDVEPVFVEQPDRIVVITVYVYLSQRGESQ